MYNFLGLVFCVVSCVSLMATRSAHGGEGNLVMARRPQFMRLAGGVPHEELTRLSL